MTNTLISGGRDSSHDIETRFKGTKWGHIALEFFTNSAHFPIANIFLELLLEGTDLFLKPDPFVILIAPLIQAYYIGSKAFKGNPQPLIGNMIGPAVYTIVEFSIEGFGYFFSLNHVAYIIFALFIGVLQQLQLRYVSRGTNILLIIENVVRTGIVLAMYWIFEAMETPRYATLSGFLSDKSHVFIILSLGFIGILLGLANSSAQSYLAMLRSTAGELRKYSEWFLGKDILYSAIADPQTLIIQRRSRAVLFMDIRGFTHWSEMESPENVVNMLNSFFERSERVWNKYKPIKAKFTGDEVMLVFASIEDAAGAGLTLARDAVFPLQQHGLSAGIGIHTGILVEGLIGSKGVKGYDVIGDTVNTAKRICDHAGGGEVLISQEVLDALGNRALIRDTRQLLTKGKKNAITAYVLHNLRDTVGN